MNSLGIQLQILIGLNKAVPAPAWIVKTIESIEVTHNAEGRSGFQIIFNIGRSGSVDLRDYQHLRNRLLNPFNRIILVVVFQAVPQVLIDGIITHHQMSPGGGSDASLLTVTGEDISVMMDMKEKYVIYNGQPDSAIINNILKNYQRYGIIPRITPTKMDRKDAVVVQDKTDLNQIMELADKHGYVFYITPGPVQHQNTAYWGPPELTGIPQKVLTVQSGPDSNVTSINFQYNALSSVKVSGYTMDTKTNKPISTKTFISRRKKLARKSPLMMSPKNVRTIHHRDRSGLSFSELQKTAQSITDKSIDSVVTATGELNIIRYNHLLRARGIVGLRGAGESYDGLYYVKQVTHRITQGEYKQRFTLAREGLGAMTSIVTV